MSRSNKYAAVLLVIVAAVLLLTTGCWDRRELEERVSVVAIGIDRPKEHPDLVKLTIQIPIPIKIAGSSGATGGGGAEAVKVMSSTGETVVHAMENMQKRLNQQLFYGHTRIIAIGEKIARSGLEPILDPFRRNPEIRRLLWPVVVKGQAADLLKASPALVQIPTVFIMELIENGARTGRIPDVKLGDFYIGLSTKSQQPILNYVEVNKNDVKWSGIAVFKRDRMLGTLSETDTWIVMRIKEHQGGGNITLSYEEDPKKKISLSLEFIRCKHHISYRKGRVVDHIHISLEGNIIEKTYPSDIYQNNEISQIEHEAEKIGAKQTERVIRKLQKDYRSDILGIGTKIKAYHPEIWRRLDWERDFPNADIKVIYHVKLRSTGMELK